jgi:hypothetical protein
LDAIKRALPKLGVFDVALGWKFWLMLIDR